MDDLTSIHHHDDPTPCVVQCSRGRMIGGRPHTLGMGDVVGIVTDDGAFDRVEQNEQARLFWFQRAVLRPSEARALMGWRLVYVTDPETKEAQLVEAVTPAHSRVTLDGIDAATQFALARYEVFDNRSRTASPGRLRTMKGEFDAGSKATGDGGGR